MSQFNERDILCRRLRSERKNKWNVKFARLDVKIQLNQISKCKKGDCRNNRSMTKTNKSIEWELTNKKKWNNYWNVKMKLRKVVNWTKINLAFKAVLGIGELREKLDYGYKKARWLGK